MKTQITFHGMEHSIPLEKRTNEKIAKIAELIKEPEWETPKNLEIWLKAQKLHPQNVAELHLKTPQFDLNSHCEGTDLYVALDTAVDKMVQMLIKEKKKIKDKKQKVETAKISFEKDKYNL